jgi:hypothetical protein
MELTILEKLEIVNTMIEIIGLMRITGIPKNRKTVIAIKLLARVIEYSDTDILAMLMTQTENKKFDEELAFILADMK